MLFTEVSPVRSLGHGPQAPLATACTPALVCLLVRDL